MRLRNFINYLTVIAMILMGIFKMAIGIIFQTSFENGIVGITAGVYTLFIAYARFIYAKKVDTDERDQIKWYRNIALILIPIAILFFISNVIALNLPAKDHSFYLGDFYVDSLIVDIVITIVLSILFVFSVRKNVFKISESNVITRSIKIVSFTSALINLVFIESLFEFHLNRWFGVAVFKEFKLYFTMIIAGIILAMSLYMVISSFYKVYKYRKERGMI